MDAADLSLFAHVVNRSHGRMHLAEAALVIAEAEYPGLEIPRYLEMIERLAATARKLIRAGGDELPIGVVLRVIYGEAGFKGNVDDYYDPRNSFLNDVLERRTGIPLTLAIVLIEVCRRSGVEAQGVSFPGHFLVRTPGPRGPIFIDPFEGIVLGESHIEALYRRATGEEGPVDPEVLEPAKKSQILLRMLNNLRGIYTARGDAERLRSVLLRIAVLTPSEEIERELETLAALPPPEEPIFN